jgi:probable rRNA maturation factor
MPVAIQIDHRNRELKPQELLAFAKRAHAAVRLRNTVTILISSNEKLQALNRSFRGKDKATDVLSFPSASETHSGDIAISAQIAAENAEAYGHSTVEEVKILILHGMLHLAGHDHEKDKGQMARLESKLRKDLGLQASLIHRTQSSAGKPKAARIRTKTVTTAARRVSRARVAKGRGRQTTK